MNRLGKTFISFAHTWTKRFNLRSSNTQPYNENRAAFQSHPQTLPSMMTTRHQNCTNRTSVLAKAFESLSTYYRCPCKSWTHWKPTRCYNILDISINITVPRDHSHYTSELVDLTHSAKGIRFRPNFALLRVKVEHSSSLLSNQAGQHGSRCRFICVPWCRYDL